MYLAGLFPEIAEFQLKLLEKCSTEKRQPYQPTPVGLETVDPNKTRPLSQIHK